MNFYVHKIRFFMRNECAANSKTGQTERLSYCQFPFFNARIDQPQNVPIADQGDILEIIFLFWLGFIILTTIVASSKGRFTFGWFLLSVLFGIFALILVALLPSLKRDPLAVSPETHVRCPDCREFVFMDATKCKHCGTKLVPTAPVPSSAELLGRKLGSAFSKNK